MKGILQTSDYKTFEIYDDSGTLIHTFEGAKLANKCLPGDHVEWTNGRCKLELRDEHPPIVGTLELTNKSKYGLTSRGAPIYLFTPYDKRYPQMIVGTSEKDVSKNRIALIKFDKWLPNSTFPRGELQQMLGISGDLDAEVKALTWQASPWRYPKGPWLPKTRETVSRKRLDGFTFNIDPAGCKDVDDVLTFQQLDDKRYKLTITISDVATYVDDGSVEDIMASLISQTLYKNGQVERPMLPVEYSEQICSLIPGKLSKGISLQIVWDGEKITEKEWFESELETDKSYSYEEFQECDSPFKYPLKAIATYLAQEDNEVTDSHKWIEECMKFYNQEAGALLKESGMGILRKHSAPDMERLKKYSVILPELEKLAYNSAQYCLAEEADTTHYGLNTNTYAHCTSPIRRYADLVNQRVLKLLIQKSEEKYIVPVTMYEMNRRCKAIRAFERDLEFIHALRDNRRDFNGIILDIVPKSAEEVKLRIYVKEWGRIISVNYKLVGENVILSRDEKREIDVREGDHIKIECAFNLNSRNWKERVIINIRA